MMPDLDGTTGDFFLWSSLEKYVIRLERTPTPGPQKTRKAVQGKRDGKGAAQKERKASR